MGPPRSCARISTSITRSLVGSASSAFTTSSAATGPEHPGEGREAGERVAKGWRTGLGQRHERVPERTTGRERRGDVAQAVGPCRLQLAQPRDASTAEVGAREHRRRAPRAPGRPARCRSRSRWRRTRRRRPRAIRARTEPARRAPRPGRATGEPSSRRCPPASNSAARPAGRRGVPRAARRTRRPRGRRAGSRRAPHAPRAPRALPASLTRSRRVASDGGSAPVHRSGARRCVSHEQRLDGEVVAQRGDHGGDLDHTPPNAVGVTAGRVVAIEVHDDVERFREHLAHDALGDVLARHQRGVHQRVERLRRRCWRAPCRGTHTRRSPPG